MAGFVVIIGIKRIRSAVLASEWFLQETAVLQACDVEKTNEKSSFPNTYMQRRRKSRIDADRPWP
jgi:hypothetical protein